jgi:hypothetical protein
MNKQTNHKISTHIDQINLQARRKERVRGKCKYATQKHEERGQIEATKEE